MEEIKYNFQRELTNGDKKDIRLISDFLKTVPVENRSRICDTLIKVSRSIKDNRERNVIIYE